MVRMQRFVLIHKISGELPSINFAVSGIHPKVQWAGTLDGCQLTLYIINKTINLCILKVYYYLWMPHLGPLAGTVEVAMAGFVLLICLIC